MTFLLKVSAGIDRLNDWIGAVLRWVALVMVLVGAYVAVGRYLTPYVGVSLAPNALNELQWYLFSVIFLAGAAYGLERDVHIRVDILYSNLSEKGRAWIDLLGSLLFLLPFSVVMILVTWPSVMNSWNVREVSPDPGGLPRYPIKMLILFSFGLLVIQGISQGIKDLAVITGARGDGVAVGAGGVPEPDDAHEGHA